ncbi:thiamine diphosphokinase [Mangrovibacillus cuniculi]|uniref:Thiamine diphosphokinase n=1 Tax=Mangrovibacillus cuniculi TaxID=2593652 RepID=A0A7S8CAN3_9BACI|nr:thiamine diphosphokinase [Mangrovibacillus cuniculi]QPC46303.1 thiamine diphosphokinase [Mangrovibacillus cuniculi]
MKKIIHLLAGGPKHLVPPLQDWDAQEIIWVGVDRGVKRLLDQGIKPTMAIGDFDSVDQVEWEFIEDNLQKYAKFNPEKDETDMELALNWALEQKPDVIRIFGATGGRLDHFFSAAYMLAKDDVLLHPTSIEIIDRSNIITVLSPGTYNLEKNSFPYVSFLPINGEIFGLTLTGVKYPLTNHPIVRGSTLCISNELVNDFGSVSFDEGILMMIRSKDE